MCDTFNITINDTAAGIGQYYRQFGRTFFKKLYQRIQGEMYMTPIPNVLDEYVTTAGDISNILKPYKCAFSPGAEMTFTPYINKVRKISGDILISCISDLQTRYLGWLAMNDGHTANTQGYISYIMDEYILPKLIEEIDTMSYKGVYNPTAATPTYMDAVDGWGTIIDNEVAAGNIIPIATGAINAGNILSKLEEFVDAIPVTQRGSAANGVIFISEANFVRYFRDERGQGWNQGCCEANNPNQPLRQFIQPYGIELVGLNVMNGSDLFMYTPRANFLKMYNQIDIPNNFDSQPFERCVKLMMDFKRGYGFGRLDCVWVNDQPAVV